MADQNLVTSTGNPSSPVRVILPGSPNPWSVSLKDTPSVRSYTAPYHLAARPFGLSSVYGAAGAVQYATIFHAATSAKTVRIREVLVALQSTTAAAVIVAYLSYLSSATTPATGNPAVTPRPHDPNAAAAEATCLALPTTAGTASGEWLGFAEWNAGITGAASVVNPPPPLAWVSLYSDNLVPEGRQLLMRPGNAEGYAVTLDVSAAATVVGFVQIRFTEE